MSNMNKYKCKICGDNLIKIISYETQPKTAQFLPTEEEKVDKSGIRYDVCECIGCGTVQIPHNPVHYYNKAIASDPWNKDPFRKKQRENFINEFNLQNKKIKRITKEPKKDKYNAFLMFNYLEHFPEPVKVLKQIYINLEDPGAGIVEVPNFNGIIKERIFAEFIIDHLFYFTKKTLQLICELSGFEVLRIEEIWEGASLSATIKKRKLLSPTPFKENEKQLIGDIDDFIDKYDSVAIYGAGHQTLMILSMIKNIDKVLYIVDDFKIKQDAFTHIRAKKIVPKEQLIKTPVDAIIVIVGWQYNYILKKINELGLNVNLAVIKKATLEECSIEHWKNVHE